tara:strand:+ start:1947 stop:3437 length:1491 start_codon:yes stop_codon:yes gene_type:complete
MGFLIKKYYRFIVFLILLLLIINILKSIFNLYTLLILIITVYFFYTQETKLFKKILYKAFFKSKKYKLNNKFEAAKKSLKSISELKDQIEDDVNYEIINDQKIKLERQLRNSEYSVILFGAGSCGKTSIARCLLNSMVGDISPALGTTTKISSYEINVPTLIRKIKIVDTPGLFEASNNGKKKEQKTIEEASKSDLIIFVIDQDLNKYELFLLKKFTEIGKSLIIALNKCDLRSANQNEALLENIDNLVSKFSNNYEIIKTVAAPQSIPNIGGQPKSKRIKINNLFEAIINVLDKNGENLLADNILFQCNKLGLISKKLIDDQRKNSAKRLINKYAWITCGVVLITPIPTMEFIAASTINIQMVIQISKIYGVNLSKDKAIELTKSLISVIATLGIVKGGMNIISSILSTNFTTTFISKSIQSITAAWVIKIVGLSLVKYFKQKQSWGDGGMQEVVENIYEINKREEILENFIYEAVQKIKKNKNYSTIKKLPPHY